MFTRRCLSRVSSRICAVVTYVMTRRCLLYGVCGDELARLYDLCYVMCRPVRCTMHETGAPQTCCTRTQPVRPYPRTCAPHNPTRLVRAHVQLSFAHAACAQSRAAMLVPSGPVLIARDRIIADMLHKHPCRSSGAVSKFRS